MSSYYVRSAVFQIEQAPLKMSFGTVFSKIQREVTRGPLLQAKQRGEKVRAVSQPKTRPVVNIMEALQGSLEKTRVERSRKPAGKKTAAKRSRKAA